MYKKEEVPVELFRRNPRDENSTLFEKCIHCRNYGADKAKELIVIRKIEAENVSKVYCIGCRSVKDPSEMALKLDGTIGAYCCPCKDLDRQHNANRSQAHYEVKLEFIYRFDVSCQKCKCIFLKSPTDGYDIIKVETYESGGIRYVNYDSKRYFARQFLVLFEEFLELRIIQFDHLPEEEQRARGILLPHQPYIPKIKGVCEMGSKATMRSEARKCQHLCVKCHIEETMSREEGFVHNSNSILKREKMAYIYNLKEQNGGCSFCKFWDPNLTRFLDMDHIDPKTKIVDISRMMQDNNYSMEAFINECNKCRVLCRHCHIIHTAKQRLQ